MRARFRRHRGFRRMSPALGIGRADGAPAVGRFRGFRPVRLRFERLETRALLAADIAVTGFTANGTDLVAHYDISDSSVAAFNISVYRSYDGVALSSLATSKRVTAAADRQVGSHSFSIAANFVDVGADYFLIVKVDSSSEISEASEANNLMLMNEGVFRTSDGSVHVQGSNGADTVSVALGNKLDVTYNGVLYSYTASGVPSVRVRSHAANDSIIMASGLSQVLCAFGGDGNDTITGANGDDIIYGGNGNDVIDGHGGKDIVFADAGNDTVYGGDGDDVLYGGAGDDFLSGGAGADVLLGQGGDDVVEGGSGDDMLDGGAGDDVFIYHGGSDLGTDFILESSIMGGVDTLDFSELETAVYVDISYAGAEQEVSSQISLKILHDAAFEAVIGTEYDDVIIGNDRDNLLYGGAGDDWIEGGVGNDVVFGEAGEDVIFGQQGDDYLYGGDDDDWIYGDDVCGCYSGDDTIDGGTGVDTIIGGDGEDDVADAPKIVDFAVVHTDGKYYVTGKVLDDDNPTGLTVTFGGLLQGYSTTVQADGTFSIEVDDGVGSGDNITAQTTDAEGLDSNVASKFVW